MNIIPEDIENLIFNYKDQIENSKKFKKVLKKIKKIKYSIIVENIGININSYSSRRDNTFYNVINTESTHTFMAESDDKLTSIITYNYGNQIIYNLDDDEVN